MWFDESEINSELPSSLAILNFCRGDSAADISGSGEAARDRTRLLPGPLLVGASALCSVELRRESTPRLVEGDADAFLPSRCCWRLVSGTSVSCVAVVDVLCWVAVDAAVEVEVEGDDERFPMVSVDGVGRCPLMVTCCRGCE